MHVHYPVQDDQFTPPVMVDCIPDHDWWIGIFMGLLNAGIDQPLTLPPAPPSPTITMMLRGAGLITEDAVHPVMTVIDSVSQAPLKTMSPMHHSQSWTSDRTPGLHKNIWWNLVISGGITSQIADISAQSRLITGWTVTCLPKWLLIDILRRGTEMRLFILIFFTRQHRHLLLTPHTTHTTHTTPPRPPRPPPPPPPPPSPSPSSRFLWSGRLCSLYCTAGLTHPCVRIFATSHWELPCVSNKTICSKKGRKIIIGEIKTKIVLENASFNSLRPGDAYMRQKTNHQRFR